MRCDDCMRDRDFCPDCICEDCETKDCRECEEQTKYVSPDSYREDE